LRKAAAKAIPEGFPGKAHAHRFRHSFGSNLIRAGVNIKIVQTLMRHESITLTLDTYGHILDTDCEKAISKVYK
jgi:integrase